MTDFTSVWDDAGESAEQAEAARAMAVAKQASVGTQQFLFLATDEADFGHRVALAEEPLFKAATAAGVSPEALVAEHRREFGLLLEAKATTASDTHAACPNHAGQWFNKSTGDCSCGSNHNRQASPNNPGGKKTSGLGQTCPTCSGARAVPAQGHESYGEVSNGQVRCPACHGHGVVAQAGHGDDEGDVDADERTSHERYGDTKWDDFYGEDPGDAQDRWYGDHYSSLQHIASIKQALEEGVDPLTWLEQEGAGEGQAEKPSEAGIEALNGGKAEASARPFARRRVSRKEAFDWLKKTRPVAAPAEDPLAGRAACPCGSRMTAPMSGSSAQHKCWNCDSVFTPKAASKAAGYYDRENLSPGEAYDHSEPQIDESDQHPRVHTFGSTGQAYDHSQFDDRIRDGDILHVPSEGVTGFLNDAWPIALHHGENGPGAFHGLAEGYDPSSLGGKDYSATVAKARSVHEGSKQAVSRPF